MVKYLPLIFTVLSSLALAYEPALPVGFLTHPEAIKLQAGEEYRVPECKKLVLKDVAVLNGQSWVKVSGLLELASSPMNETISWQKGSFTYSVGPEIIDKSVIIHPSSTLVLFSKEGVGSIEATQYSWVYEKGHACGK